MLVKILSYAPAIIGLLTIGIFVLFNNPQSAKNRLFAMANLNIALWLSSLFLADVVHRNATALWALRVGLFFGSTMILFLYYFTLVFPYKSQFNVKRQLVVGLPLLFAAILSLTPLVVPSVGLDRYGVEPHDGSLYALTDVVTIAYVALSSMVLLLKYRRATIQQKSQIKFILTGLAIALAVNIVTNLIFTLMHVQTDLTFLGGFSLFIFSVFVAYAIIRHGFLNIRLIVAKSFAYLMLVGSLSGIYAVSVFGVIGNFFGPEAQTGIWARVVYLVAALVMAFTFQPLRRYFNVISNRLFYQDAFDPQVFLDRLNNILVGNQDLSLLVNQCVELIEQNFRASFVSCYLYGTAHIPEYFVSVPSRLTLNHKIHPIKTATAHIQDRVIVTDSLLDEADAHKAHDVLSENGIGVFITLPNITNRREGDIGYIFLGYKKSGNPYSAQDLRLLEIVASELVIAIQNALRFAEIKQFNVTLEKKVEEAVYKLQQTNDKLRKLDETKDEFISMASHQLRTPLTSVKGYLSMVLEGDAGNLNKNQRKLLEQSFVSSQRMVYLISDLLNLSRLNTGRFVIESTPIDLSGVIQDEVNQLAETAKSRELELIYHRPEHFPMLMLDENKIHQVVMNFLDNAIYYTPSGGSVTIDLHETPTAVVCTVKDTGIGVPRSVQHKLFTKFYRAQNAQQARPDGTGLGLFMAKKVVAAQGGSLIFESTEGKGSTFGFRFSKARVRVPPDKDKEPADAKAVHAGTAAVK